jgi:pentose-5-phosphate-3-epimerase
VCSDNTIISCIHEPSIVQYSSQVNPGYGGPKYTKQAVTKIRQLRSIAPDLHIAVDGGVNERNAPELIQSGANVLVAGGGIFKVSDKRAAIDSLKSCAVPLRVGNWGLTP